MTKTREQLERERMIDLLEREPETYCGLDPITTGPNDPYHKTSCEPHDLDYEEMKRTGNKKVGLLGVSARWVENTSKVFVRSIWGIVGFPFYLVGGLIGGAIRWRQIFPEDQIEKDKDSGEMF